MASDSASISSFDNTDRGLLRVLHHLNQTLEKDAAVRDSVTFLRKTLQVNRVVLYYFYREWEGRVTFESLSDESFSILGSTGPDECFNDEYAELYRAGRVRSIPDVYLEPIADCHREFLRSLHVKANMVAPILVGTRLWGLLVAHHCEASKNWSDLEVQAMLNSAKSLAKVPAIALS